MLGCLVHGVRPYIFTCYQNVSKDSNLTVEVLNRVFARILISGSSGKKLYVQMDNCWRENKNK